MNKRGCLSQKTIGNGETIPKHIQKLDFAKKIEKYWLNLKKQKNLLRKTYWSRRERISISRRKAAACSALFILEEVLKPYSIIMAYASFGKELDLWELNGLLASEKRLVLPRIHENLLLAYLVTDPKQLKPNCWGILEPDPDICEEISICDISAVLVPGLAFGKNKHRLGYGKGFYDKFLEDLPLSTPIFGVGFAEQGMREALVAEKHDIPLTSFYLF